MAQHDQVIEDGAGIAVRDNINQALAALFSSSSGAQEPTVIVPGQLWFDISDPLAGKLWLRNSANDAWLALYDAAALTGFRDFVLNASGIWTKPAGLKKLDLVLIGAGGGSAGAPATAASQTSAGGAGGGGAVIEACYHDVSILPAEVNYTVGAAGIAGAAGGAGGAGGDTIFKLLTAGGGKGGTTVGPAAGGNLIQTAQALGGVPANTEPASCVATLSLGQNGNAGIGGTPANWAWTSQGGGNARYPSTIWPIPTGGRIVGTPGTQPGMGACGSANGMSVAAATGAAGYKGQILMREWF